MGFVTTPTFQLRWQLLTGLALRGAWGRYISAPHLADLDEYNNGSVRLILPDPTSAQGATPVLAWYGKNKDLRA